MYKKYVVNDLVKIDPVDFDKDLKEVIIKRLNQRYQGKILEKNLILFAANPRNISDGIVIHNEDGLYFRLNFDLYVITFDLNEVIKGEITDTSDFGVFINLGPLEGLCHISQLGFSYYAHNPQEKAMIDKEDPNKKIKVGDKVLAKVVSISLKDKISKSKIGLTMRQPGLGVINE